MRSLLVIIFFLSFVSTCFSQNAGNETYGYDMDPGVDLAIPHARNFVEILSPVIAETASMESPAPSPQRIKRPDIIRNFFLTDDVASFSHPSKQIGFKQTTVHVATGSGFKYPVEKSLSFFVQPLYQRKGEIFYSKSESKDRLYNAGIRAGFGWYIL